MTRTTTTTAGRPAMGRPVLLSGAATRALAGAAALLALTMLAGCQTSQAEREGTSRLPVNRPSSWESPVGYVEGEL